MSVTTVCLKIIGFTFEIKQDFDDFVIILK